MSCIVGILNLDGAPVERELLRRMADTMKVRAPDETNLWVSGNLGFGHAMLRITPESEHERQPRTLDGYVWITADVRIDGRAELIRKLRAAGEILQNDSPDVDLILHAYSAFGESFLKHLIGDFAFALWDDRIKRLICARDRFGVRPFHYVKTERLFSFASDPDALLKHPLVTRQINQTAVGDFLLLGVYMEPELTIYQSIHNLPPASVMYLDGSGLKIRKYWDLPQNQAIRYTRLSEYVEHFRDLHTQAVVDRLRASSVALELSGGMDSSSIAAIAAEHAKENISLEAYTLTANSFFRNDEEGAYAREVAKHVCISQRLAEVHGGYKLFERLEDRALITAEPISAPFLAATYENLKYVGKSGTRVFLTGHGGDAVLESTNTYYQYLLRTGRIGNLFADIYRHVLNTGTLSGMGLRSALLRRKIGRPSWMPAFPDWFDEDFVKRTSLKERWEWSWDVMSQGIGAQHQLGQPWLNRVFSRYEVLKLPIVAWHPFYDIRLVEFLLALPGFVKTEKRVMREAMHGKLPESVRVRPKTPAVGDVVRNAVSSGWTSVNPLEDLHWISKRYISHQRYCRSYQRYAAGEGSESTWPTIYMVAPIMLEFWVKQHQEVFA